MPRGVLTPNAAHGVDEITPCLTACQRFSNLIARRFAGDVIRGQPSTWLAGTSPHPATLVA